jgi:hypothetical protein
MSIEAVIVQTLLTWPGLSGIVVRPDKAEEGDAAPYLIFQKIIGTRVTSLTGDSGLANPHFQFDLYALTRLQAVSLRKEVRLALQANSVLAAVHLDEGAGYDPVAKLRRERQDFSFWFND